MIEPIRILAIPGSLRKNSYNLALLRNAQEIAPPHMDIVIFQIDQIPLYDPDQQDLGDPAPVVQLKQNIAVADALIIATPEYNHSIPGVLKNALDWASRPARISPMRGKPLAIIGAGGRYGTLLAQKHLHEISAALGMHTMQNPRLLVSKAWESFDENGMLVNEKHRVQLKNVLDGLAEWTLRFKAQELVLA